MAASARMSHAAHEVLTLEIVHLCYLDFSDVEFPVSIFVTMSTLEQRATAAFERMAQAAKKVSVNCSFSRTPPP